MDEGKLNILVFPWLAFGHMIPFLELSKSLAKKGHLVSFLSTPRNIQRLPVTPLITFVPFPLPPSPGLPANAEATTDLLPDQVQHLKKSFDNLAQPITTFIKNSSQKPDWIIQDFAQHWLPPIAGELGVPCAFFSSFSATAIAFFGPECSSRTAEQWAAPPEWIPFATKVAYRHHETRWVLEFYKENASGVSDVDRCIQTIKGCKVLVPRSCMEFEAEWLELLQQLYVKPVIPVGHLPPPVEERGETEAKIIEWLDEQTPGSVVYVALGSEAMLETKLLHELALGLELSKVRFLWALRRPAGAGDDGMQFLPKGFEERIEGYGVVEMGWVPQLKVLAHGSVGGFLTHCGWNSIIEGLQYGHPLVLLPIFGDQGLNARVMEEKGVGVEVERNEEDGSFSREAVARVLRLVMVEEGGEPFRVKAKEMRNVFGDKGCQESYVESLVQYLKNHKN